MQNILVTVKLRELVFLAIYCYLGQRDYLYFFVLIIQGKILLIQSASKDTSSKKFLFSDYYGEISRSFVITIGSLWV